MLMKRCSLLKRERFMQLLITKFSSADGLSEMSVFPLTATDGESRTDDGVPAPARVPDPTEGSGHPF